jgi:far upstream element-binding protein
VNLIGSREAAARAKDLIMEIVESDSKSTGNKDPASARREQVKDVHYGGNYGGGSDKINDSIFVPSEAVGMIIGKG